MPSGETLLSREMSLLRAVLITSKYREIKVQIGKNVNFEEYLNPYFMLISLKPIKDSLIFASPSTFENKTIP